MCRKRTLPTTGRPWYPLFRDRSGIPGGPFYNYDYNYNYNHNSDRVHLQHHGWPPRTKETGMQEKIENAKKLMNDILEIDGPAGPSHLWRYGGVMNLGCQNGA